MSQVCVRVVCAWVSMSRYMKVHMCKERIWTALVTAAASVYSNRTAVYVMYVDGYIHTYIRILA